MNFDFGASARRGSEESAKIVEEEPLSVQELLKKLKSEHATVKRRKDFSNGRMMKGRT